MIEVPTVFVLGAGASMDYGLPSGRTLVKEIISSGHNPDNILFGCLKLRGFSREASAAFANTLQASKQSSVDAFLEHQPDLIEIGKIFIAYHLLAKEIPAVLFDHHNDNDWYALLLDRMNTSFDRFGNNAVSIITFNYDRSLEQCLLLALMNRHNKSEEEVASKLQEISIKHVHGQLGFLGWQTDKKDCASVVEYGALYGDDPVLASQLVYAAARNIKIISETEDDTHEFLRAQGYMRQSERIFFLGFGYHPTNMRRLKTPFESLPQNGVVRYIGGTCYGLTQAEKGAIMSRNEGFILGDVGHKVFQYLKNESRFLA